MHQADDAATAGQSTLRTGPSCSRLTKLFLVDYARKACDDDGAADNDHDGGEPKREKSALRSVAAPAEAEPNSIEEDDAAEKHQHDGRNDVRDPHPDFIS